MSVPCAKRWIRYIGQDLIKVKTGALYQNGEQTPAGIEAYGKSFMDPNLKLDA